MIKEGRKIVVLFFVLTIIIFVISSFFKFFLILSTLFCILTLLLINFFRDPERNIVRNDAYLYSPADGTIFDIQVKEKTYCIKIFMSIFNVHIQRSPVKGVVKKIVYLKGRHLTAGKDKTELFNEKNIIEIENSENDVFVVTQISGILARRIICWVKEQDYISQGQKIGAILLGSQVNFEFPKDKYNILVTKKQKVYAGITPVAIKVLHK